MSLTVYPQLASLLAQRRWTVAELERRIKARFGLVVNPKSLYRLTQSTPVQRADLEIAGATAAVLGVGLDDLFHIETSLEAGDHAPLLGPEENAHLSALLERQNYGALDAAEWTELENLILLYGRALHQRRMAILAQQEGISEEQAEAASSANLALARAWWDKHAEGPEWEETIATHASTLRARWPE